MAVVQSLPQPARDLIAVSEKLFSERRALLSLWQEIADQFYPERADFTYRRYLGDEFADHLMDSYPVLVRRDLGNTLTAMLRPRDTDWLEMSVMFEDTLALEDKQWLEWASRRQRRAMYDRRAMFTRATKEGDHDFITFGQCVIHVSMNRDYSGLLYRTNHLRDCAWSENDENQVDMIFVKRKLSCLDVVRFFGEAKVHQQVLERYNRGGKHAQEECSIQHMIVPAHRYELNGNRFEFVSLYVDIDNQHVMEAVPSRTFQYVVPRWQTVSGSQYAYSPSTIVALPDARLIQSMTLVLLEAGEKYVNPPMIATQEVVRSDMAVYAGGVTWVDGDYDERLGAALRPLTQDKSGMPIGFELSDRHKEQLTEAFYLNQVRMPVLDKEATAYEVGQMVNEYIRRAMPLFEPMEFEYNGQLCEETFTQLMNAGGFGSLEDVPRGLVGQDIEFKFRSPLHEADGRKDGQKMMEAIQLAGPLMQIDPTVLSHIDIHSAFRDAMDGLDVPQAWMVEEELANAAVEQQRKQAEMAQMVESGRQMAETVETAGRAGQEMASAEAASTT